MSSTALSGSGPAYFFLLAELMAEAADFPGLDAATARQLAAQTLAGAGRWSRAKTRRIWRACAPPVTSKGGTTAGRVDRI